MPQMAQFSALAKLTALEVMRQPVSLLLSLTCVVCIALCPLLVLHNLGEPGRLARDGGLAFHLVFGVFVAGYAACSALARELRSGTAAVVLSKPVGRGVFFLGKFAGVAWLVGVFSTCAIMATLLAERVSERFVELPGYSGNASDNVTAMLLLAAPLAACLAGGLANHRYRRSFQSTTMLSLPICLLLAVGAAGCFDRLGHWAPFDPQLAWRVIPAGVLIAAALLVFAALALALSTRLTAVPTLSLSALLLAVGLLSEHWFGQAGQGPTAARVLYRVLPDWQLFWTADHLARGGTVVAGLFWSTLAYGALYAAAALCAGSALLRHTDLK